MKTWYRRGYFYKEIFNDRLDLFNLEKWNKVYENEGVEIYKRIG